MGKSTKNSISRTTTRPARRARRGTAAATVDTAAAASADTGTAVAPAAATPAPAHHEVQQLAFHYFAEAGYAHGNALDHWLRAETELTGE